MTTLERNVEEAIRSAEGLRWMRGYLQGLLDAGEDVELLRVALRHVYEGFLAEGNETAADIALDSLDLLTGWHGPGMGVRERSSA